MVYFDRWHNIFCQSKTDFYGSGCHIHVCHKNKFGVESQRGDSFFFFKHVARTMAIAACSSLLLQTPILKLLLSNKYFKYSYCANILHRFGTTSNISSAFGTCITFCCYYFVFVIYFLTVFTDVSH